MCAALLQICMFQSSFECGQVLTNNYKLAWEIPYLVRHQGISLEVLDMIVNVRDIKYFGIYKLQWPILTTAA